MKSRWWPVLLVALAGCAPPASTPPAPSKAAPAGMVWIPGGEFQMGSEDGRPDERPVHTVELDGFWMDTHEVTNAEFKRFIDATGYVTVAERPLDPKDFPGVPPDKLVPGSLVFHEPGADQQVQGYLEWWVYLPGASWKHPLGPESDLKGLEDHPVTHVAYEDAEAYAKWAGKSMPTEAQWEYAARGGLKGESYPWGNELVDGGKDQANIWQGTFPRKNTEKDGFRLTAPVGSFAPNGYGLYDMAGNVWEWCADWYRPDGYTSSTKRNPTGPDSSFDPDEPGVPKHVVRGGSFLCTDQYCSGYRVASRMKSTADTGLANTGFRCVKNPEVAK
ncbi:MAG: formylglycine-generating enzyme family protein [Fimbriimonadaceae bacterium]|nr:formylglycine-generating enzyme family protein [Fimbriimonadaceae bacterium]